MVKSRADRRPSPSPRPGPRLALPVLFCLPSGPIEMESKTREYVDADYTRPRLSCGAQLRSCPQFSSIHVFRASFVRSEFALANLCTFICAEESSRGSCLALLFGLHWISQIFRERREIKLRGEGRRL